MLVQVNGDYMLLVPIHPALAFMRLAQQENEENILCYFSALRAVTLCSHMAAGPRRGRIKPYLVVNAFSSLWGLAYR